MEVFHSLPDALGHAVFKQLTTSVRDMRPDRRSLDAITLDAELSELD